MIWCTVKVQSEGPKQFKFSTQPKSQTAEDGSPVNFTCAASNGRLPVRYSWYKMAHVIMPPNDDNEIETSNQTITLTVSRSDSRLLFQCCAESEGQKIFSDVAKVTISYFGFRGKSVDRYLAISDPDSAVTTSLACFQQVPLVASNAPFKIIWYKGATKVEDISEARAWMSPTETTLQIHIGDDSTTSSQTHSLLKVKPYDLVLYNLVLTDSATYFCKAVQRNRMILLATWTLQVRQEFAKLNYLISQPVTGYLTDNVNVAGSLNNQVEVGKNVTLLCGGIGYCDMPNKLSYTWYRDGHVIEKGRTLSTLDSGRYDCAIICGPDGLIKMSSVTVPVPVDNSPKVDFTVYPPEYIGHILGRTADRIDIPCSIQDTARFRKNYYLNGEEVQVPILVSKSSNLKSGVVQCSFLDKLTQTMWVQKSTQLTIIGKPSIEKVVPREMSFGNTLHVFPLETVTFSFQVKSLGPTQVTLLTDDVVNPVCNPGSKPLFPNERCSVAGDTYSISIRRFNADNERRYTLRADHEFYVVDPTDGSYTKKSYTVTSFVQLIRVDKCNTTLEAYPRLQVYPYGTDVTLTCTSLGHPVPDVQFYKDGNPLGLWESSCKREEGRNTCELLLSSYHSNGLYSCHVFNVIRGQRNFCNTSTYSVAFVGDPTVASVEIHDTTSDTLATCIAEGNPSPRSVYWLTNEEERIDTEIQTINFYRVTSTLNVSEGLWPYQCCVADEERDFRYCHTVELEVEEYEVFNPKKTKGIDKILIVGIVTGGILAVVFFTLALVIFLRRRTTQTCNNTEGAEGAALPTGKSAGTAKEAHCGKLGVSGAANGNAEAAQTLLRVRPVSNPRYANNVQ